MPRSALVSAVAVAACALGVAIGYAVAKRPLSAIVPGSDRGERAAQQVREILADTDALRRVTELGSLLARLGPEAVPAVTAVFEAAPLNRGDVELALLGSWWAGLDPEAAWQWAKTDWRAEHTVVMAAIARSWAHSDPKAALDHAQLPFRGQARVTVAAAMAGWEEAGHPGLLEYVQGHPDPMTQQRLGETLAERKMSVLGAEQALAWADALPQDFATVMRPRVASAIAEAKPAVAAAWAEPRIAAAAAAGSRPTGLPRRIGTRWVKQDPEAAMAWLASLPAGADRNDGLTETIRTWAQNDLFRARLWLEQLELEPWNEPVLAFYARSILAGAQPQQALELVARFQDVELRDYHTTVIVRAWMLRDREGAQAWLEQADIPAAVKKRARLVGDQPAPVHAESESRLGSLVSR